MPRSSVTPVNVFPVASLTAVMVTPGKTAPVASVTVPVIVASCAKAIAGNVKNMTRIRNRRTKFIRVPPGGLYSFDDRHGRLLPRLRGEARMSGGRVARRPSPTLSSKIEWACGPGPARRRGRPQQLRVGADLKIGPLQTSGLETEPEPELHRPVLPGRRPQEVSRLTLRDAERVV